MEKRFIMTAFGQDRVGIVADVTQIIFENECNLEDSNMTRLSDEFAIIFLFSSQKEDISHTLDLEIRRLEREKGISSFFREVSRAAPQTIEDPVPTHRISVEGIDQGGIMYKTSRYLAENQVNIVYLNSKRTFSPQSGTALYKISIYIQIPEDLKLEDFEKGLRRVGDKLHVDIKLSKA